MGRNQLKFLEENPQIIRGSCSTQEVPQYGSIQKFWQFRGGGLLVENRDSLRHPIF